MSATGNRLQPTIFELSRPGRGGGKLPAPPAGALDRVPADQRRAAPPALPELNEPEVVRHYVNLSQLNHAVDTGFYPLGSCTMKYNPKIDEWAARLAGFAQLHPLAPDETAQGTLQLLWEVEQALIEISGMEAVSLHPAAGAQGELTGILMIRAYHRGRGEADRDEVLVPDSSHGTNPATATMAGFRTITVPSAADGGVDVAAFTAALGPRTAAVMITNPSTLGLFESRIGELLDAVHAAGALAYMDGANLNAILGRFKPGKAGFDVMHINTHKTFSTPHGGGGPGSGPVGVGEKLLPYLPGPRVLREADGTFRLERPGERPESIGRLRSYTASTGVLVRAFAYIFDHGGSGLEEVTDDAVLAANYLKARLAGTYDIPYPRHCMHEFVASATTIKKQTGVRTLDIAKRLMDYGFHPPTIYFPLIVDECMLIEPTETETLETLDAFADALIAIAGEAHETPDLVTTAPQTAPVKRLDEATAARHPNLRWKPATDADAAIPGAAPVSRLRRGQLRRGSISAAASRLPYALDRYRCRKPPAADCGTLGRWPRDHSVAATHWPRGIAARWVASRATAMGRRIETNDEAAPERPATARSDEELLRRMQADELDAFEEFFVRYRAPIYRTAYGLTGDPQAAEEILQDTFARAYQRRAMLRVDVSPLPWLHRVALNLCYSRLSRRRPAADPIDGSSAEFVADAAIAPADRAEQTELRQIVRDGVRGLPEKHRSVVVLYYLYGLSLQETATLLNVRLGTVKSRLHYALRTLRQDLEGDRRFGSYGAQPEASAEDSQP